LVLCLDIGLAVVEEEAIVVNPLHLDKLDLVVEVEETYGQTPEHLKCLQLLTLVVAAVVALLMKMDPLVEVQVVLVSLLLDIVLDELLPK
tara:strand:+ start:266 stop:535 length:270 start_codon:yes stop_codon:yes gene_type:complete